MNFAIQHNALCSVQMGLVLLVVKRMTKSTCIDIPTQTPILEISYSRWCFRKDRGRKSEFNKVQVLKVATLVSIDPLWQGHQNRDPI